MSGEFPTLSGENLKNAKIKEGKMLEEGANYGDKGLVATEEQIESANQEMYVDSVMKKVDQIFEMSHEGMDKTISALENEIKNLDKEHYEYLFKFSLLKFLRNARLYAKYKPEQK